MFKTRFFSILALLLMATGAWAETTWEVLSVGSTTGMTLGESGTTKYYYPTTDLEFSNTNVGGSGLTIRGTVYLYIPEGVTITATGANASGATGAGAGIELAEGNVLYIIGKGKVIATGGNAANGGNGGNGGDAILEYDEKCQPGSGGNGGNGGGGAGAGIGTRGGNGGNGGTGATAIRTRDEGKNLGVDGNAGSVGNAAGNMGELYVDQTGVTVTATGGSAATSGGAGGNRGKNAAEDPYHQNTASGGGGGGGGGFGGAASNIGTGGPGGGGGGGGAAGNSAGATVSNRFYYVGAGGGKGGSNADDSNASDGVTSTLTDMNAAELKIVDEDEEYEGIGWESDNGMHYGGNGGGKGSDSSSGSTNPTTTTNIPPAYAPVTKYNLTLADGTEDAANWQGKAGEGEYQALPLTGLEAGTAVTVKYNGTKKVKSVKAKKKAVPATTDLSTISADYEAKNGETLTGTLANNVKISIADGATVTLKNVNITNLGNVCNWAGINCPGDATLVLEGTNEVCAGRGGDYGMSIYPGIWIAPNKTLTIQGAGNLTAYSGGPYPDYPYGAGIGGGFRIPCGNIVINSGTITATGGYDAAGIGAGGGTVSGTVSCGNITINGGTITATGDGGGAGIGGSYGNACGNITISGGTVSATGGYYAAGIGGGRSNGACGTITIKSTVTSVTATKGSAAPNSIGSGGENGTAITVTIEDGANVTQN